MSIRGIRRRWIVLVMVLVVVAAVTSVILITKASVNPIPTHISQSVLYPLYYPAELPQGYQIDQNSFSFNDQVIIFTAKSGSKTIAISEQPKPSGYDFEKFYSERLNSTKQIVTRSGNAVVGVMDGTPVTFLVTDKTLVIIRFPADMRAQPVEQTTKSLTLSAN